MTNLEILRTKCKALASTFCPDQSVLEVALFDAGIEPTGDAKPKDIEIIKVAVGLVSGFVASSYSEAEISVSTNLDAVKANIKRVCAEYGLDASAYVEVSSISDASNLW